MSYYDAYVRIYSIWVIILKQSFLKRIDDTIDKNNKTNLNNYQKFKTIETAGLGSVFIDLMTVVLMAACYNEDKNGKGCDPVERIMNTIMKIYRKMQSRGMGKRVSTAIAGLIVFVTVYSLILPALTLENKAAATMPGLDTGAETQPVLACEFEVHTHTDDCYADVPVYDADGKQNGTERVLTCGKVDYVVHHHDENCYQTVLKTVVEDGKEQIVEEKELVCTLPEIEAHVHSDSCYKTEKILSCGKEESEDHKHTDKCYKEQKTLVCSEPVLHRHSEKCYEKGHNGDVNYLICGKPELLAHQHDEACFKEAAVETQQSRSPEVDSQPAESLETDSKSDESIGPDTQQSSLLEAGSISDKDNGADTSQEGGRADAATEADINAVEESLSETDAENVGESVSQSDAENVGESVSGTGTDYESEPAAEEGRTADASGTEAGKDSGQTAMPSEPFEPSEPSDPSGSKDTVVTPGQIWNQVQGDAQASDSETEGDDFYTIDVLGEDEGTDGEVEDPQDSHDSNDKEDTERTPDLQDEEDLKAREKDYKTPAEEAGVTDIPVEGASYRLQIDCGSDSGIPENAVFKAVSLTESDTEYGTWSQKAIAAVSGIKKEADQAEHSVLGLFDLSIYDAEGNKIQPVNPVTVTVDFGSQIDSSQKKIYAVHFPGSELQDTSFAAKSTYAQAFGKRLAKSRLFNDVQNSGGQTSADTAGTDAEVIDTDYNGQAAEKVQFQADSFSVYVIVGTVIEKNVLASDGHNYHITVTCGADSGIPEDAELEVSEITEGSSVYGKSFEEYVTYTENALEVNEKVTFARFFNIKIVKDEQEIQPERPVEVKIELADELTEDVKAVHFGNEVEMLDAALVDADRLDGAVTFEANGFSVYGVILAEKIETTVITADGSTYRITVNCDKAAAIPEGAVLKARELTGEEYALYRAISARALQLSVADISYARIFDISIEYNGKEIQPSVPVSVAIELVNNGELRTEDVQVVHFSGQAELVENESDITGENYNVEFMASGFSVYAIIGGDQSDPETYSIKYVFRYPDGTTPYTFVNVDGKTVDYQYVTNGEAPYNVGTPTDDFLQQDGQEFVGWYGKNDDGTWEASPTIDVEGNGKVVTGLTSHVAEKILYPRYDHAYYVYYYDETATLNADGTVDQNIYMIDVIYQDEIDTGKYHTTVTEDGKEEAKIDYIPNALTEAFLGWSTIPGQSSDGDVEKEITIPNEGVIRLFPVTAPVYWISFEKNDWDYTSESDESKADWKQENGEWVYVGANNGGTHTRKGTGALYVAPMYTLQGEKISDRYASIPTTTRPGYDFVGWFLPDGTQLTSNYQPTADVTVTARWTPSNNQSYNVIYWRQNATDEVDAETKTYSYDHSETRYAQTGASVSLTAADRNGAGTGFSFNEGASTVTATVAADGSTVLNVYYDRNVYAMVFNVPGNGYAYTPSDSGTYGYIDGEFVPLTQSVAGTTTEYYLTQTSNGTTEYTGTVYSNTSGTIANNPVYGNTYYRRTGTLRYTYYQLYWNSRAINTYSYTYNGQEYTGPRFTRSNTNGINYSGYGYHKTAKVILALYGHSIKDSFPIEGSDSTSYDGWSWSDTSGSTYSYVLKTVEEMPAANVIFRGYSRPKTNLIYYYVEALPGSTDTRSFNGKQYVLYKSVYHSYNYITYDEEYHPINGFERNRLWAEPQFGTNNQASIPSTGENYLYYNRNSYNFEFWDSFDSTQIGDAVSVLYEMPLTSYESTVSVSSDASTLTYGSTTLSHEGYVFTGWYADPECTKPFDFSAETMPSNAVKVYAGWQKLRYRVWIQPNGGQLSASESTYFKADWGELIEEYEDVQYTRTYIEDENGEYSYVYIADTSNEARVAYYKKTSELTTVTLYNDDGTVKATYNEAEFTDGKSYSYKNGVYTFVGWYKVNGEIDENTPPSLGRDADEIWNFNNPITENIAIKAIWKRQGTFTIVYSDTSLDGEQGSLSPDIHDQNVYYDLAQAVAEKAATPPEGNYVFKGWRTPDGEIHQPGDLYTIKSDYAEPVEGQTETYTYTLTPIFEKLDASSLTYDVNGGSGTLSNPGSAEKGCTTDTNSLKNIVMDTAVTLSDGVGFTRPGYVLTGWNSSEDPNAADAIHFDLGGTYGISEKENTLYAEWTPVCFDLEFLKQGEELKEITFESEYKPLNGAVFSLTGDGVSEEATSSTVDTEEGIVKFENVRPGENRSLTLTETFAPTGYQKDDAAYTVAWETPEAPFTFITIDGVKYIQATGVTVKNAASEIVTEIINKRPFVSLTLYKVDSTNTSKKLDEAEFKLTRDNNGAASNYTRGDHIDGKYVTSNGEFVMDLADGVYTLTEKIPPAGYIITTNGYTFAVEDGVITGNNIDVDENGNYSITVTNDPGAALPNTGGPGTTAFYFLGIMLTGIAGAGLVMRKRRRDAA